ncbi:MAG: hypothetical protein PHI98_13835 [Eubacteriales bacterium]|nr:hypothetical protein [Eubacteriales bacterium]
MAIVSSKDVDLQALADKKLIKHWWFIPNSGQVLPQWLLSDELLSLLPSGIMQSYDIYFFDYDVEAADTTIVIMNANSVDASNIPQAMLDMRNANLKRNMEGIARAENWTVERLISNPESWDTATLLLSDATKQFPDGLRLLDEAGLLFDFSQNSYLASRQVMQKTQPGCSEMLNGYFNPDGKMIAIPVEAFQKANPDELQVFLVNAKSAHVKEALEYGEHYIKACEWVWSPANTWEPTVVNEELLKQFWR